MPGMVPSPSWREYDASLLITQNGLDAIITRGIRDDITSENAKHSLLTETGFPAGSYTDRQAGRYFVGLKGAIPCQS